MKPFEELFIELPSWTFKSSSGKEEYKVVMGSKGLYCSCWGYRAHKKCKHIKAVEEKFQNVKYLDHNEIFKINFCE